MKIKKLSIKKEIIAKLDAMDSVRGGEYSDFAECTNTIKLCYTELFSCSVCESKNIPCISINQINCP